MPGQRLQRLWHQQADRFHRWRGKKTGACFCGKLPDATPTVSPGSAQSRVTFASDSKLDLESESSPSTRRSATWHLRTPQECESPTFETDAEGGDESARTVMTCMNLETHVDLDLIANSDEFRKNFREHRPIALKPADLSVPTHNGTASSRSGRNLLNVCSPTPCSINTKYSLQSLTDYSDTLPDETPLLLESADEVRRGMSLVDFENSLYFAPQATFCGMRMQAIHNALVKIQWGDTQFYSGDLQRTWLSVDTEDLKFYRYPMNVKFLEDLRRVMSVSIVSSILFPLRFLVSVFQYIFYTYVIHHTSSTDMVYDTAFRMRSVLLKTSILTLGCLCSWWYLLCMFNFPMFSSPEFASKLKDAINPESGFLYFSELYAPVEALCMVLALIVIRKQRRDMRYLIDIIRPRILLHEAGKTVDTKVFLGPVWRCRRCQPPHGDPTLWLVRRCPRTGKTKLQTHAERLQKLLEQVQDGTGVVSDLNEKAKGMKVFANFDLNGLLQQRMRKIEVLDKQMNDPKSKVTVERQNTVTCRINISELIEMLCAGYDQHFCQNDTETILKGDNHSWMTMFLSFAYATFPTVHAIALFYMTPVSWQEVHERLKCRVVGRCTDHDLQEVVVKMVILGAFANFVVVSHVITRLLTIYNALHQEYECLQILQRMISTYHASYHGRLREDFQKQSTNVENKSKGVDVLGSGTESLTRDVRKAYWFHSSLTRGTDCHAHIKHTHGFDKIMMNKYGVVPEGQCAGHCHSFIELDLQDNDQLQLWWAVRKFVEAGLLDRKLEAELTLTMTAFVLLVHMISTGFWSFKWGSFNLTLQMGIIRCAIFGFAMNKVMRICAQINTILKGDGDRLTFIQHDLVHKMTQIESNGDRNKRRSLAKMQLAKQTLGAVRDNIDRDHNPMQIFGLPITMSGIQRVYYLVYGTVLTLSIKLISKVIEAH